MTWNGIKNISLTLTLGEFCQLYEAVMKDSIKVQNQDFSLLVEKIIAMDKRLELYSATRKEE